MLKVLLTARLQALWQSMFGRMRRRSKQRSASMTVLIGLFAVYVVGCLLFSFGMLFYGLAEGLLLSGLDWLYFAVAGLLCLALCFVGSVFTAQAQLYDAKDNELLLSMPIPPWMILASRLLMLLILNVVYTLLLALPALVVYALFVSLSAAQVILFLLACLLLPVFSMSLSCLCGWFAGWVSSKLGHRNLISTIFMLVFLFGYMYLYINLQNYMTQLIQNGTAIGQAIQRALPPVYYFGTAIGQADWLNLLWLAVWCLLPFTLLYWLLSHSFLKIATAHKGGPKARYVEKHLSVRSPRRALLAKELKRFFSLPAYVLNCGLGAVMTLLLTVALVWKRADLMTMLGSVSALSGLLPLLLCGVLSLCATMNDVTAASVSLEGRSLWLLKSMPVRTQDIFFAKLAANLIVGVPPLVVAAVTSWLFFPLTAYQKAMVLIVPILAQLLTALLGLTANLCLPRFDWINETVVIKQSASVLIGLLGSIALVAAPALAYIPLAPHLTSELFLGMYGLYLLVLCTALGVFVATRGRRLYEQLVG